MILNVHSDASYLSEPNAKSRVAGHYFLGQIPKNGQLIMINGNIFVLCRIFNFVVCLAVQGELAALFFKVKARNLIQLILKELGCPQLPMPVHCDNQTASGFANNMRFFWITDQVKHKCFYVQWHPGQEN
jgi:hypothetical protein